MNPNIDAAFARLRETWNFFLNNAYAIILVVLTINVPVIAFQLWIEGSVVVEDSPQWIGYLPYVAALMVGPLSSAAVILLIARIVAGERWTLGAILHDAFGVWPQLIVATALVGGIVVLGLFALILPGIYLFLRLAFVEFAVVLEGKQPFQALERGFHLTKDRVVEILQPLAILFSAYIVLHWLVNSALISAGLQHAFVTGVASLFFAVLSTLFTILLYRLYQLVGHGERP